MTSRGDRREDIFLDEEDRQALQTDWIRGQFGRSRGRAAMAAAYATGDYTMQEIATCFGVHYTTVSRAVKRAEQDTA